MQGGLYYSPSEPHTQTSSKCVHMHTHSVSHTLTYPKLTSACAHTHARTHIHARGRQTDISTRAHAHVSIEPFLTRAHESHG